MSGEPTALETTPRVELDPTKIFNNFFLNFPMSERDEFRLDDRRVMVKRLGKEDQLIGDDYQTEEERARHSAKFLGLTYRQFFEEIDKTARDKGVSLDEVKKMRDDIAEEKDLVRHSEKRKQLDQVLKPVFEGLLERPNGFIHYDLSI